MTADGAWSVLVVERETEARSRMAAWLREEGFAVLTCQGPSAPDFTCPAGRGEACPLVRVVDVIVVDPWLESDTLMVGTPGAQVLLYYLSIPKPVVVLSHVEDPLRPAPQEGVAVLRRPVARRPLVAAVWGLVHPDARLGTASAGADLHWGWRLWPPQSAGPMST